MENITRKLKESVKKKQKNVRSSNWNVGVNHKQTVGKKKRGMHTHTYTYSERNISHCNI